MRQKLGQHFLINKGVLKKITSSLQLKDGEAVVEIGPGHGELTEELRITNKELRIIAIEKDGGLAVSLKKLFGNDKNIEIIHGDALKILKSKTLNLESYKLVGNIPYYITGYLLRVIGELAVKPALIILTIQKEVAERICAKRNRMNLLAASVQFWADPEILEFVPKKYFYPEPEVDSTVIKLTPVEQNSDSRAYYGLIKALFKQPRKNILNNLKEVFSKEKILETFALLKLKPDLRPQNIGIETIKKLVRYLLQ